MPKQYTTLCVPQRGDTHERLDLLGVKQLNCNDIGAPSCGHLYSRYYRLDERQLELLESFEENDDYTLTERLRSPVWGMLTLEYVRSPTPKNRSYLPVNYMLGPSTKVIETCYTFTTITTAWGLELEGLRGERGYSRFEFFIDDVKKHYTQENYAFDPNSWSFLPNLCPNSMVRKSPGLTACWEGGEIKGYSYQISRSKDGEWEGVGPKSTKPRWLPPPC